MKLIKHWKEVLIIDDMEGYILPEQKSNWIKAEPTFVY